MAKKKAPTSVDINPSIEVAVIKSEDVLGLGEAAKSPAAKAIARSFTDAIMKPIGTYLAAKAEGGAAIARAKSRLEVARIDEQTEEILRRAGQRFLKQEGRHQVNIEATVAKAIEFANEDGHPDTATREIPLDWFLRWSEGAQQADDVHVQELWARLLALKPGDSDRYLRPSIFSLLMDMDGNIADLFLKIACELVYFRCLALDEEFCVTSLKYRDVKLLEEHGLVFEFHPSSFDFGWLDVQCSIGKFGWVHTAIGITQRADSLALAIFGKQPLDKLYPDIFPKTSVEETILNVVLKLSGKAQHDVKLTFKGDKAQEPKSISITDIAIDQETWTKLTADIVREFPDRLGFVDQLGIALAQRLMPASP